MQRFVPTLLWKLWYQYCRYGWGTAELFCYLQNSQAKQMHSSSLDNDRKAAAPLLYSIKYWPFMKSEQWCSLLSTGLQVWGSIFGSKGFPPPWVLLCCSMGSLEGLSVLGVIACMFLFSLGQEYFPSKQHFEAPVRIMVSSSYMLFSCTMPLISIMLSIA